MSTNAEPATAIVNGDRPSHALNTARNTTAQQDRPSLTEALTLRRNLLQSLWIGVRQLPRGRRIILMIRLCVSFAQIVAFIPILALPGSHRVSPSHEQGRVCDPDSLFKYLVVHIVRLALDIPVELYLGLSPHRTRQGRRAGPEARAIAERDRPLGSEYLDLKVGKISTLLGIASLVIFFVGNAIVYSSTECSQRPADAVPLFWAALASLIVVYIFIVEIAVLAFLIVCALPLLIVVLRALGLNHRLPQRELHPETGKIDQEEVDKRLKLVYYTPAEEEEGQGGVDATGETAGSSGVEPGAQSSDANEEAKQSADANGAGSIRPGLGSRRPTQDTIQSTPHPALGRFSRLTRILVARRRSSAPSGGGRKSPATPPHTTTTTTTTSSSSSSSNTPRTEPTSTAPTSNNNKAKANRHKLKYPLHPLPAHRATCPICLCDFEEPSPDAEEEPEPLRLLECGHVMHRSCVDQWLTTVSGRCPVCQRAVVPGDEPEARREGDDAETARRVAEVARDDAQMVETQQQQQDSVGENHTTAITAAPPLSGETLASSQTPTPAPVANTTPAKEEEEAIFESHELQPLPSCSSASSRPTRPES
ncbi:uncharacterized protein UTRI_03769_B [Ustilago trichophora]|uniref:RING-type E3 ubiquitin transferase n=1 Tax=Ustilago trichophora TaxID=86804 RepID=A0A5C3DZ20_9BASI|nr:uncharacterized protein UTRI_03769_B [Ustilago trichophora]